MFLFKKFLLVSSMIASTFIPALAFAQDAALAPTTDADLQAYSDLQMQAGFGQNAGFGNKDIGSVLGAMGLMLLFIMIPMLAIFIYAVIAMIHIAKKTGTPNGWLVIFPLVAPFKVAKFAGMSYWWGLVALVPLLCYLIDPIVYFITLLASAIFMVYLWMRVCERLGFSKWLGLLMIVPIANLVLLGFLAFSKGQHSSVQQA